MGSVSEGVCTECYTMDVLDRLLYILFSCILGKSCTQLLSRNVKTDKEWWSVLIILVQQSSSQIWRAATEHHFPSRFIQQTNWSLQGDNSMTRNKPPNEATGQNLWKAYNLSGQNGAKNVTSFLPSVSSWILRVVRLSGCHWVSSSGPGNGIAYGSTAWWSMSKRGYSAADLLLPCIIDWPCSRCLQMGQWPVRGMACTHTVLWWQSPQFSKELYSPSV